jgi:hypothetical protein
MLNADQLIGIVVFGYETIPCLLLGLDLIKWYILLLWRRRSWFRRTLGILFGLESLLIFLIWPHRLVAELYWLGIVCLSRLEVSK